MSLDEIPVDPEHAPLTVIESDDGILLLGSDQMLAGFDASPDLALRRVPPKVLAGVGAGFDLAAHVQANSGRWLKLTEESAAMLKAGGVEKVAAGVIRGKDLAGGRGGQIVKHLKFENLALVTPAAPAAVAAMATQASLEAALDEIKEYLEQIDAKLDQLLKQRKAEVLGQLGGVMFALDEADSIFQQTGRVSAVTWSKVQANALALQAMQAEAVAQLGEIAERIKEQAKDTDRAARTLDQAQKDAPFWLGVLARTLALQDRQYVLELARVAEEAPGDLEPHRQGIRIARAERARKIERSLDSIRLAVQGCASLTNLARVANPFSSQKVTRGINGLNENVAHFARHAGLDLLDMQKVSETTWGRAVRGLLGEAASGVHKTSAQARSLGAQIQDRREGALLARAEEIRRRREQGGMLPDGRAALEAGADERDPVDRGEQ